MTAGLQKIRQAQAAKFLQILLFFDSALPGHCKAIRSAGTQEFGQALETVMFHELLASARLHVRSATHLLAVRLRI
jgi:hypothetical protein